MSDDVPWAIAVLYVLLPIIGVLVGVLWERWNHSRSGDYRYSPDAHARGVSMPREASKMWSNNEAYSCGHCGATWRARSRFQWWPIGIAWRWRGRYWGNHAWHAGYDGIEQRVLGRTVRLGAVVVRIGTLIPAPAVPVAARTETKAKPQLRVVR